MVRKAGRLDDIELRPHDHQHHAVIYASMSSTSIEIVGKDILRHANLLSFAKVKVRTIHEMLVHYQNFRSQPDK